jgi:ABC-type antimicrobial peptide transport system permease subunit
VCIPAAAVVMLLVALLAASGPARRALAIHPAEAVREG